MSFAGSFQAIAARYGQTVTLWRDGEIVGTGRAVLRPLLAVSYTHLTLQTTSRV